MVDLFAGLSFPIRIRPARPMTDDELIRFSGEHKCQFRIEREPNGELSFMTPFGTETSRPNSAIGRYLDEWTEEDGRGIALESNGGSMLPLDRVSQ